MKREVKEEEVVKHYGIWFTKDKQWLVTSDGIVYTTTCPRVANVQHDFLIETFDWTDEELEVREVK